MKLREYLRSARHRSGNLPVTINSFPYTLQASDNGKNFILQPSAQAVVNVIPNVSCTFTMARAGDGNDYPVQFVESGGAQVSNSGYRISNANNMANSWLLGQGKTAVLTATTSTVSTLTGSDLGAQQQVVSRTHYCDQLGAASITEIFGSDVFFIPPGVTIQGVWVVGLNAANLTEAAPAGTTTHQYSIEFPIGSTPQFAKFSGVNRIDVTGAVEIMSDYLPLTTPLSGGSSGAFGRYRARNANAGGSCMSSKGSRRFNMGGGTGYFIAATGTTTSTEKYMDGSTALIDTAISTTAVGGGAIFAPVAIVGITSTGAKIILVDSRAEPSNGDYPTPGGSPWAGEGERVHGRFNVPMLNIACASAGLSTLNQSTGTLRRALMRFGRRIVVNGVQNDLNAGSVAAIRARVAALKADPRAVGKPLTMHTTSPFVLAQTGADQYSTVAGQSAANTANDQTIEDWNNALAAGTVTEADYVIDLRSLTQVNVSSGLSVWPGSANPFTVTDVVSTTGSNVITSASGKFLPAHDGKYISIVGYLTAGTIYQGRIKYVSATQAQIMQPVTGNAINAGSTPLTAGTAYIDSCAATFDGTHMNMERAAYIEANCGPLIPAGA